MINRKTPQDIARIKANLEKDNNELIILSLLRDNVTGVDNPMDFFMHVASDYIKLGRDEFIEAFYYFNDEYYFNNVNSRFFVNRRLEKRLELLEIEKAKKDIEETRRNRHFENEAKLAKWQVKTFWWFFSLGLLAGTYSVIDLVNTYFFESDYIRKDEIQLYLKEIETKKISK